MAIDSSKNEKTLRIARDYYIGAFGADGWVGWKKYWYRVKVPLGRYRNIITPYINSVDVDSACVYGYITFNEERHEIMIKCREIDFPSGYFFDVSHGGNARSVEVVGDHEIPINGILHTDNPDAFK